MRAKRLEGLLRERDKIDLMKNYWLKCWCSERTAANAMEGPEALSPQPGPYRFQLDPIADETRLLTLIFLQNHLLRRAFTI